MGHPRACSRFSSTSARGQGRSHSLRCGFWVQASSAPAPRCSCSRGCPGYPCPTGCGCAGSVAQDKHNPAPLTAGSLSHPRVPPSDEPPLSPPEQHPQATPTPHLHCCLVLGMGCEGGSCPSATGLPICSRGQPTWCPALLGQAFNESHRSAQPLSAAGVSPSPAPSRPGAGCRSGGSQGCGSLLSSPSAAELMT